ncbi:hypothetical protein WI460_05660 [Gemmatimonadota bacterium Y43]|uniref:hypothetical protein n=1 Tax=Gaopeijia maritima TaxID=3119007 RepID=UPI00328A7C45
MKSRLLVRVGRRLVHWGGVRIAIADDEAAYFTPQMLQLAEATGFGAIERHYKVDHALLSSWIADPPDIVLLDVKGVAEAEVAKDGFGVATLLAKSTSCYVVITSAHQFHLKNALRDYDYVLEQRLLTAVDFVDELEVIVDDFFARKSTWVRRQTFRAGRLLIKASLPKA